MKRAFLILSATSFFFVSCMNEKGELPKPVADPCATPVSYSITIAPMILTYCGTSGCHDGVTQTDFSAYDVLVGDKDNILSQVTSKIMPKSGSPALSDENISKIQCWISKGANNN